MLDDGGIVGESSLQSRSRLRRLTHPDVLDVGSAEDDVLVSLIPWSDRTVSWPVLGTIRANFGQSDSGLLGVDGVEDSLVTNLRLGDQRDLGAKIRNAGGHGESCSTTPMERIFPDSDRKITTFSFRSTKIC